MTRFLLKRLGLAVITLFLLSLLVFWLAQLLPGDVGRALLGQVRDQEAVDASTTSSAPIGPGRAVLELDERRRARRPRHVVTFQQPVSELLGTALSNSLKLARSRSCSSCRSASSAAVRGALRAAAPWTDRVITVVGLSFDVVPEFVTGIVLILVFSIWLDWLPVTAQCRTAGAGPSRQVEYLHPAGDRRSSLVLFGYIARITRAGVIEALDADYTRTAYLKGLPHVGR